MMILFGLGFFVLLFGGGAMFGYTILKPLETATGGKASSTRFYLCDFFTLSFLVAIPAVFVTQLSRGAFHQNTDIIRVLAVILISVFVYVWYRVATSLSRAGVVNAGKRCLLLGVLVPIAVIGSALVVPALVISTFALPELSVSQCVAWLAGSVSAAVIAWVGRRGAQWVLSPDGQSASEAEANESEP